MYIGLRCICLFWFLALSLRSNDACAAASVEKSIEAGAAEIDITPPVGMRMAGYFDERFSTGVHDPLKAKALALRQNNEQICMRSEEHTSELPAHSLISY